MKSESTIQRELWKLIEAYKLPGTRIFHVANGEWRSPRTAKRLKEMGVLPGVPDFCFIAENKVGFLEMKTEKGRLSDVQLDFMGAVAFHGVVVDVARSVIEGARILQQRGVIDPTIRFVESEKGN